MGKVVLVIVVILLAPWVLMLLLGLLFTYYLGPLSLVGAGLFGPFAGAAAINANHQKVTAAEEATIQSLQHVVTVDWSGGNVVNASVLSYTVREDYEWNIVYGVSNPNAAVYGVDNIGGVINEIYANYNNAPVWHTADVADEFEPETTLSQALDTTDYNKDYKAVVQQAIQAAQEQGLTFGGLYTAPQGGGEQYANANGCALRSVTRDITLYAVWR